MFKWGHSKAGSLKLEDAVSLDQRPFLHNSTLPLCLYVIAMLINCTVMANQVMIKTYSTLAFVAVFTHHLRDASRRGLWFSPWIQSLPVSYPMYIFLTVFLCLITRFLLFENSFLSSNQAKLPMVINDTWTRLSILFLFYFNWKQFLFSQTAPSTKVLVQLVPRLYSGWGFLGSQGVE